VRSIIWYDLELISSQPARLGVGGVWKQARLGVGGVWKQARLGVGGVWKQTGNFESVVVNDMMI